METSGKRMWMVVAVAAALIAWVSVPIPAAQVANPGITASADPFNAGYVAGNVFDDGFGEFATSGNSAGTPLSTDPNNGTWIQFDFGSPVTVDTFVNRTRANNADIVGDSRLIFSQDATFDASDPAIRFRNGSNGVGQNGQGFIRRFTPQTAQYARWEVTTSIGTSTNLGARQMFFLDSPAGLGNLPSPTVIDGFTAFDARYALPNAANGGNAGGVATGNEYASLQGGANTFVDFDFGRVTPIAGFDFFDREHPDDTTTGFDLIFSNASDFSSVLATRSYDRTAAGGSDATSDTFKPVHARYVRFDVTSASLPNSNSGISEIQFYAPKLPDPSVVSVSSQFNTTRYAIGNLFDDQLDGVGSDWAGIGAGPHTLVVDFGRLVAIDGIDYAHRRDGELIGVDRVSSIALTFSDDLDFTGDPTETVLPLADEELNGYTFDRHEAQYVQLVFTGTQFNPGGAQLDFLGEVVPEPGTLALAALAFAGLGGYVRRRRRG